MYWYKTNEQDNQRFYLFVLQLSKDNGYFDNVQELINFINGRTSISPGLQTVLNYKIELADSIVEYQRYISSLD